MMHSKQPSDAALVGPTDRQTAALDRAHRESSRRSMALEAAAGGIWKQWFVIRVAPNRENDVDKSLSARLIDHWLPLVKADQAAHPGRAGSNGEPVWVLAWPGYMFVRIVPEPIGWEGIRCVKHTLAALGTAEHALPIGDEMLMQIKAELATLKRPRGNAGTVFAKDDAVMVKEGPFASHQGRIADLGEGKREGRALVEVMIFGRVVPVELDLAQLAK